MKIGQLAWRNQKWTSLAAFAAVLATSVLMVGCAGGERAAQGEPAEDKADKEAAAAEREASATAREGETVEPDARDGGDTARAGEVELRIGGKPGTEFSGTCSIRGEEQELSGEVPRSFTYRLDGGELECEVTNEGPGALEVVLKSGNDRSVQRTNGSGAIIKFTYSGNGVSSSTTSSSSGSVSQSSSSVGSDSVIISNSSSSGSSSVNQQVSQSSGSSR